MRKPIVPNQRLYYFSQILLLAGLYIGTAILGLSLASIGNSVTLVWAPTGIALAALLVFGCRLWPGLALGAFCANALTDAPLGFAFGTALGNPLQALSAVFLLRKMTDFAEPLERVRDVFALLILGVLLSSVVSATIGAVNACINGIASWSSFGSVWRIWWLGDALGVLLLTPVLLSWRVRPRLPYAPARLAELIGLLALLVLASVIVYGGWLGMEGIRLQPLSYVILPFLIWGALRFGQREVAITVLIGATIAVYGTARGFGPFAMESMPASLMLLACFVAIAASTGLILGAAAAENRQAKQTLQQACDASERRVIERTADLQSLNARLRDEIAGHEQTEASLRLSEACCQRTFDQSPIGAAIVSLDYRIEQVNQTLCDLFGYSREELIARTLADITHPEDLQIDLEQARLLAAGEIDCYQMEKRYLRKDGRILWGYLTVRLMKSADGRPSNFLPMLVDITERKAAEACSRRLTRLYAALGRSKQAIMLGRDREELFPAICRIAIEDGGMKMAWIGEHDPASQRVVPIASHGEGLDYLDGIVISSRADSPAGRGPAGIALRENRVFLCQDFPNDPVTSAWHERGRRFGWGSAASFPIEYNDQPSYVLNVYSAQPAAFDEDAVDLLREMTTDIAFALLQFDREAERKEAVSALLASEKKYRTLVDNLHEGIWVIDKDAHTTFVNPRMAGMLGFTEEEMIARPLTAFMDARGLEICQRNLAARRHRDGLEQQDFEFLRKDGARIYASVAATPLHDENSDYVGMLAGVMDITERRKVEETLRQSVAEIEDLYNRAPCGYLSLDRDGVFVRINDTALSWLGYTSEEAIGKMKFTDLISVESRRIFEKSFSRLIARGWLRDLEFEMSRKDGTTFPVLLSATVIRDANGNYLKSRATLYDMSERKQSEDQLRKLSSVIEQSHSAVLIANVNSEIEYCNPKFYQLTGYAPDEVIGQNPRLLQSGDTPHQVYQELWKSLLAGETWRGELLDRKKDGESYWCLQTVTPIKNERGEITHYVSISEDISERKHSEEVIQRLAYFDPLTQLPNRSLFRDRLTQAILQAQRSGLSFALMYLDLDHFKNINDTLGHVIGDKLLKAVADRIKSQLRASDTIARLGGDEFAVIVFNIRQAQDSGRIAEQLIGAFSEPFVLEGHELFVTPSIGISLYPSDSCEAENLIKAADIAMYRAKERGRSNYQFFTPDMNALSLERLKLENGLRRALERDELLLHYQPKIDLANGNIIGAEALIRWQHPELGMIPPAKFIPIAEESGLIKPIGEWVLRTAIRQGKAWQDMGLPPMRIAVNLSSVQFRKSALTETVLGILQETGLSPCWVELEVTETMVMESPEQAAATLNALKSLGLWISIDDFGTGYSSLSYLKRFPVDTLKIDRSFVKDVTTDPDDAAIVKAIIGLAASLHMRVIAEGVENEQQFDFLREHQCDEIQGYYFSPPVPADDFVHLLQQKRGYDSNDSARTWISLHEPPDRTHRGWP